MPRSRLAIAPRLSGLRVIALRAATDCRGATAIEYALLAAGVALAIIGVLSGLSDAVVAKYEDLRTTVE
jgi:pilus assembly protein Flp/PilA